MDAKDKLKEIQILLFSLPCTANKEYGSLLRDYKTETSLENVVNLFDRIFSISKYTNTEVYHFLSVFSKFLEYFPKTSGAVAQKVISLKFFPAEKDTELAIYKYFEVVNKMEVEGEALQDIYSRYIFLQSKEIVNSVMLHFIYTKFKEFLEKNPIFLKYTVEKGIYKEMILRNEFLMDFFPKLSGVSLVDSSFESSIGIRIFVINSTRNKYLMQEFFSDIPEWYLKSLSPRLIPFLYYNFDVYGIYRELGLEYVNTLDIETFYSEFNKEEGEKSCCINTGINEDIKRKCSIKEDINDDTEGDGCENTHHITTTQHSTKLPFESEEIRLLRARLKESIATFNKTLDMDLLVNTFGKVEAMMLLRSSKGTNLRSLGDFLCKAKNESMLGVFTSTFDFQDMTVIEALRVYLGSFYLVGESQVIHRVLEAFTSKYFIDNVNKCTFMEIKEDEKTRKFLFNFSFSLLVLNTKMYNPNIKVKPTFTVHMQDFTKEEIPGEFTLEYLQSQFESVCERKLDLAVRNKAGKENYVVYESLCEIYGIPTTTTQYTFDSLLPYKDLFRRVYSNYLESSPRIFFTLCTSLGEMGLVDRYLREAKSDTQRFLRMFSLYMGMEGDLEMYRVFLQVLRRIEKPRNTILPQYRTIFQEIQDAEIRDINLLAEALRSTSVSSLVVDILVKHYEGLRDISMLPDEKISLVLDKAISCGNRNKFRELSRFMTPECLISYYKDMLETVPRFLNEDICQGFKEIGIYNEDSFCIVLNLQKEYDMFDFVVELKEEKIECRGVNEMEYLVDGCEDIVEDQKMTKNEDQGDSGRVEDQTLSEINQNDQNHFKGEDDSERVENKTPSENEVISSIEEDKTLLNNDQAYFDIIHCRVDLGKDILSCYSYTEKFKDILNIPTNLFHFYASSKSILNQSKAKTIHKTGCPLQQDLFSPLYMDCRLIYMLKKASSLNNKDVSNYSLWVINLISASLPLFCRFFLDNFGLLLTIKNVNPIIKIFCSRLSKSLSGNPLCCKCGFNKLTPVENLIKMIVKYDLASVEDFHFYFSVRMEKIKNGEIGIENGELILKDSSTVK